MDRQTLTARDLGKTRRRRVLAVIAALGAVALVLPALAGAAGGAPDSPTPPKDIYSYAVFGWDSVGIKGANGAKIARGNVGVNNVGGTLNMCQNGPLTMDPHYAIVGDNLGFSSLCKLYDMYWGTGHQPSADLLNKTSYHGGTSFKPAINPTNVPAFPTNAKCKTGQPDIIKQVSSPTYAPPPGVYQSLIVKDGTSAAFNKVVLGAGTYTFCNMQLGKSVWLDLQPTTTVIVTGVFSVSNESAIGHVAGHPNFGGVGDTSNAQWFVRGDNKSDATKDLAPFQCQTMISANAPDRSWGKCDSGTHVGFSKHTYVASSFFARNGQLNLGHDTDLHGRFWAKTIGSDWGTRVENPVNPPPGVTTTTSVPGNTTPPTTTPRTTPPTTGTTVPPTVPPTTPPTTTPPTVPPTTTPHTTPPTTTPPTVPPTTTATTVPGT